MEKRNVIYDTTGDAVLTESPFSERADGNLYTHSRATALGLTVRMHRQDRRQGSMENVRAQVMDRDGSTD